MFVDHCGFGCAYFETFLPRTNLQFNKSKISIETIKSLILFVYTHINNNWHEIKMYLFSKGIYLYIIVKNESVYMFYFVLID